MVFIVVVVGLYCGYSRALGDFDTQIYYFFCKQTIMLAKLFGCQAHFMVLSAKLAYLAQGMQVNNLDLAAVHYDQAFVLKRSEGTDGV